jgi:hypothetical protein
VICMLAGGCVLRCAPVLHARKRACRGSCVSYAQDGPAVHHLHIYAYALQPCELGCVVRVVGACFGQLCIISCAACAKYRGTVMFDQGDRWLQVDLGDVRSMLVRGVVMYVFP